MLDDTIIYLIGFAAQLMFASRIVVQWLSSERAGQVTTPLSFWFLSLGGAILMVVYGVLRHDLVITVGQAVLFCIYCRNVTLSGYWSATPFLFQIFLSLPLVLLLWPPVVSDLVRTTFSPSYGIARWLLWLGGCGQLAMFTRFVLQWRHSERMHRSMLPCVFWWTSLAGAILLLAYAIFRQDIVLITGQVFGIAVYLRNLAMIKGPPRLAVPTCS
jgi:lipid-A-disaccharide synthase-like uncharacterized protein